jgi:hypothetical protein
VSPRIADTDVPHHAGAKGVCRDATGAAKGAGQLHRRPAESDSSRHGQCLTRCHAPSVMTAEKIASLGDSLLAIKQEQDDRQSDETDQPVLPEHAEQSREIGDNPAKEWHSFTKEDLHDDP